MEILATLLAAVLRVLLPWAVEQSRPTAEDASGDRQTRDRLREQIRAHCMIVPLAVLLTAAAGCGARTVYVPHGTPVRLRETIRDAKVWVKDADGQVVAGEMDLYEGWYALPLDNGK